MPARSRSRGLVRCRMTPLPARARRSMGPAKGVRPTKVYFIYCETTNRVKCGFAIDPRMRLGNLQVGSPTILRLIGEMDGDEALERAIKKRLSHFRVHGEWFEYLDDVREIIIDELTAQLADREQFEAREAWRCRLPISKPRVRDPP